MLNVIFDLLFVLSVIGLAATLSYLYGGRLVFWLLCWWNEL